MKSLQQLIVVILAIVAAFAGLGAAIKLAANLRSDAPSLLAGMVGERLRKGEAQEQITSEAVSEKAMQLVAAEGLAAWLRARPARPANGESVISQPTRLQAYAASLSSLLRSTASPLPAQVAASAAEAPAATQIAREPDASAPGKSDTPLTDRVKTATAQVSSGATAIPAELPNSILTGPPARPEANMSQISVAAAEPKAALMMATTSQLVSREWSPDVDQHGLQRAVAERAGAAVAMGPTAPSNRADIAPGGQQPAPSAAPATLAGAAGAPVPISQAKPVARTTKPATAGRARVVTAKLRHLRVRVIGGWESLAAGAAVAGDYVWVRVYRGKLVVHVHVPERLHDGDDAGSETQ